MSKQKGRKALIILSDGVDNGSKETLTKAIEAAQRADTIIYAIYFKGEEHHDASNSGIPGGRGGGYPGGAAEVIPAADYPAVAEAIPVAAAADTPAAAVAAAAVAAAAIRATSTAKKSCERMADETGGRLFEVSKKQTRSPDLHPDRRRASRPVPSRLHP